MWRRREKTGTALYLDSRQVTLCFWMKADAIEGARVAAPSVCFAAARILLAAAPTAPPCFRHWRRSSPLQVA